jgi:hypothetical protein
MNSTMCWCKIATDLGSLIGSAVALIAGVLAYVAGWLQARATRQAADRQLAAATKKDRLQAQCIAVGVYPELLGVQVAHEEAVRTVNEVWSRVRTEGPPLTPPQVVTRIRNALIPIPPLLNRSIENLYLLGDAGPSLLQLVSVVLQYDDLVDTIAANVERHGGYFGDPPARERCVWAFRSYRPGST